MPRRRIAVIGTGVSGLVAAHVLHSSVDVTLYEADDRAGGHAHTHTVNLADGSVVGVDTGFIVHNNRTYPTLQRLFRELDVPTQPTDMSMSVSGTPGWEYAGGKGPRGLLADPRTAANPRFLRMLREVSAFHRQARRLLDTDTAGTASIGDWLAAQAFSPQFLDYFMRPVIAAVWSCAPEDASSYPAGSLLTFLDHHGMLTVTGSPTWRTVTGGSREYVKRVLARLPDVRLGTPVARVTRAAAGVTVHDARGHADRFDAAVIATHPHQALAMQPDADPMTRETLGAITYSANTAVLHTDSSILPRRRGTRASWNYRTESAGSVVVTYDLTRLQRLPSPDGTRILVTLNASGLIDPAAVLDTMHYEHPLYTQAAVEAQRRLPKLSDRVIAYAGAYHGWGFHEDGALSGLRAAETVGGEWA